MFLREARRHVLDAVALVTAWRRRSTSRFANSGDEGRAPARAVHVLQFADLVNRHDFIDNIVRYADHESFHMAVCTMGRPSNIEEPKYAEAGFPCVELRTPTRWHYPLSVIRLARLMGRQDIDIVHAHHYEPCLIAAAATLFRPRTKLVVGRHYSDAIYLHTVGWRRRIMLRIEWMVNRRASRIIAPSSRIKTLVDEQGVPADKVVTVPYGFDPTKYEEVQAETVQGLRATLGLNGRFTIATFGRLYTDKGHRFVLDALPQVLRSIPNLKYLVAGEGAERTNLERQVFELGLNEVVSFLGWRHDVPQLMAAVDVVVQPSLQEAFSQSMAEALFMGRPLVIADVSAATELVPNSSVGVVVPCADSAAIAHAIIELEADPRRRELTAEAARKHAYAAFTVRTVVPLYEKVYRECMEGCRWN